MEYDNILEDFCNYLKIDKKPRVILGFKNKNPLHYIAALNNFSQPPYPIYSWTGYNFSKNFSKYST